ncbi:MAG: FAD-binding oxidoreductase [Brevinematia bacterium]
MLIEQPKKFIEFCKITQIEKLGSYVEIKLSSERILKSIKPGQFLNVKLNSVFFRRPFTLFRKEKNIISILVKIVGKGTKELSNMKEGQEIEVLGPLGNSILDFGILEESEVDLVAGGVGIANMITVGELFKKNNKKVRLFWGIRTKEEYFEKYFEYFDDIYISSEDGSVGEKGLVTQVLEKKYTGNKIYTCGPIPMIRSISQLRDIKAEDVICSLETVMGCGIGICYGCNIGNQQYGYLLICKDGPNFRLSEIEKLL